MTELKAGAATVNITPQESHFLFGYPFVDRMSTGTHDDLLSSALYLTDGKNQVLFISNDVIYVSKASTARIREGISKETGIQASNILVAATHTHSAPVTVDVVISANDPIVPKVDRNYLKFMEENTVKAACQAVENATLAEIAVVVGDATGVGTNRHNPEWAKDTDVPAVFVKNKYNDEFISCMLICNMHPTILHENSTLYSSDFPHFVRKTLQEVVLGNDRPVIYFTGTAGNQSPRHVTKSNTFEEAKRIGQIVADSISSKLTETVTFSSHIPVSAAQKFVDLPKRAFPSIEWAVEHRDKTKKRFEELKKNSEIPQEVRTAEVNWFGSEELLYLSKLAQDNKLEKAYQSSLPAEIQIIKVGEWKFVAWPGEVFVEYGIELKNHAKEIALITYANGELQGYLVTQEAQDGGYYEAGNSFFDYKAGKLMLAETIKELKLM
ncbi:MAG: neutral/alkaline non-lysosomal ceramidase N-terminal domain-containing protein [Petrimonas sp.]|nr:neutral/alkaline non-lysosomal ceramidase N-terminal domain-containing protein [Petrimonas sp.]